jgi:hypothetical protein
MSLLSNFAVKFVFSMKQGSGARRWVLPHWPQFAPLKCLPGDFELRMGLRPTY